MFRIQLPIHTSMFNERTRQPCQNRNPQKYLEQVPKRLRIRLPIRPQLPRAQCPLSVHNQDKCLCLPRNPLIQPPISKMHHQSILHYNTADSNAKTHSKRPHERVHGSCIGAIAFLGEGLEREVEGCENEAMGRADSQEEKHPANCGGSGGEDDQEGGGDGYRGPAGPDCPAVRPVFGHKGAGDYGGWDQAADDRDEADAGERGAIALDGLQIHWEVVEVGEHLDHEISIDVE